LRVLDPHRTATTDLVDMNMNMEELRGGLQLEMVAPNAILPHSGNVFGE